MEHVRFLLPIGTLVLGLLLMIYMIQSESEPGALPLLLVLVGTGWFFFTLYGPEPPQHK